MRDWYIDICLKKLLTKINEMVIVIDYEAYSAVFYSVYAG